MLPIQYADLNEEFYLAMHRLEQIDNRRNPNLPLLRVKVKSGTIQDYLGLSCSAMGIAVVHVYEYSVLFGNAASVSVFMDFWKVVDQVSDEQLSKFSKDLITANIPLPKIVLRNRAERERRLHVIHMLAGEFHLLRTSSGYSGGGSHSGGPSLDDIELLPVYKKYRVDGIAKLWTVPKNQNDNGKKDH